jgi:hypothetical protein
MERPQRKPRGRPAQVDLARYGQGPPQRYLQALTQSGPQLPLQQLGKNPQTHFSQTQPPQPPPVCCWHISEQLPQSSEQFWQFSPLPGSHWPLPQLQGPQSTGQFLQSSYPLSQTPLPHCEQEPQSLGQVEQVSPNCESHWPLPQQAPQSTGQVEQSSPRPAWQMPLPQQEPQSFGQVPQFSPRFASHWPLPQQELQSLGQFEQVSP